MNPRLLSYRTLVSWEGFSPERRPSLASLADEMLSRHGNISGPDKALFTELVFGVTRWRMLLDFHIKRRLKSKKSLPMEVMTHLRIGTYQLLFLERIPPSASVDEAVKGIKKGRHSWAAGLVNAVLRKISEKREKSGLLKARSEGLEELNREERLCIETSHPGWMTKRWIKRFGWKKAFEICRSNNIRAPLSLRANTLKTSRNGLLKGFREKGIEAVPEKYSRDAVMIKGWKGSPAHLPFFEEGLFQVQDEASQLASIILAPGPGERILDACAGLGGKATHLAQIMKDKGRVDAWDINPKRLDLLRENANRLGISSIRILEEEEFRKIRENRLPIYDRIILDAPCSGLGVIRRHPDIKWNRNRASIKRLATTQMELLSMTAPPLKPGGMFLYSTCSFEEEETDFLADGFIADHPDLQIFSIGKRLGKEGKSFLDERGLMRIFPEKEGPDGFFAALLQKKIMTA